MPNYDYSCLACDTDEERNVKIAERDNQNCQQCGNRLNRNYTFHGAVWAPTSSGATLK